MEELAMLLMGSLVVLFAIALALCALYILAYWRIFKKAGEAGWKALIPIYSTYVEYKLMWNTKMFIVTMALAVLTAVLKNVGGAQSVFYLVSIAATVMNVIVCVKMSYSFGHGMGFALGLVFLNPIFLLILAFDQSEYVGPGGR